VKAKRKRPRPGTYRTTREFEATVAALRREIAAEVFKELAEAWRVAAGSAVTESLAAWRRTQVREEE
jgi:hypothetical protein